MLSVLIVKSEDYQMFRSKDLLILCVIEIKFCRTNHDDSKNFLTKKKIQKTFLSII